MNALVGSKEFDSAIKIFKNKTIQYQNVKKSSRAGTANKSIRTEKVSRLVGAIRTPTSIESFREESKSPVKTDCEKSGSFVKVEWRSNRLPDPRSDQNLTISSYNSFR